MEWKIGEIKQVNGEWYQCIEGTGCYQCAFNRDENTCIADNPHCTCRSDKKDVVFKKLEKVGEPYEKRISDGTFSKFQRYKVYNPVVLPKYPYIYCNFIDGTVEIEIKQTKDMGERDDIRPYDEYFSQGTVSNTKHLAKSNLKPFDIEAAKAGKPVCTRDGRKARIICFNARCNFPIIALITQSRGDESLVSYKSNGRLTNLKSGNDLMMLTEKKEGWVNVYKDSVYDTKDEALIGRSESRGYIDTIKISWEE